MKLLILLISFAKLLKYLRFSKSFGFLIKMMLQVFVDIKVFMFMYFSINILIFFILFVLGVTVGMDDYPDLSPNIAMLYQVFRNSIGDIALYTYEDTLLNTIVVVIVTWGQIVVNIIVFLNFLIAEVSATFERISSTKDTTMY